MLLRHNVSSSAGPPRPPYTSRSRKEMHELKSHKNKQRVAWSQQTADSDSDSDTAWQLVVMTAGRSAEVQLGAGGRQIDIWSVCVCVCVCVWRGGFRAYGCQQCCRVAVRGVDIILIAVSSAVGWQYVV